MNLLGYISYVFLECGAVHDVDDALGLALVLVKELGPQPFVTRKIKDLHGAPATLVPSDILGN